MNRTVHVIYPEDCRVSEERVCNWAKDLWYSNAPKTRCTGCGLVLVMVKHGEPVVPLQPRELVEDGINGCECDAEIEYLTEEKKPLGLEACMQYLEDKGVATFARKGKK